MKLQRTIPNAVCLPSGSNVYARSVQDQHNLVSHGAIICFREGDEHHVELICSTGALLPSAARPPIQLPEAQTVWHIYIHIIYIYIYTRDVLARPAEGGT